MTADLRSNLTLLVVLALLGVGLAVIGTAVGATNPLTTSKSSTAFVVSEENITFEHGDQQATVLDNVSNVSSIKIEQQGSGTYRVNTETDAPLNDSERSESRAIARDNETVQKALRDLDRYELTVEPVHKLTVDSGQTISFTDLNTTSKGGGADSGERTLPRAVEDNDETSTVTIDRDPKYVKNEAVVRIRDTTTDEIHYSATVDLRNETVTDITGWDTI